jgi:hypothetical protein
MTLPRLITFGTFALVILGSYIAWYQKEFRPLAVENSYSVYENSRIDYGRDHDLKAAIFCELSNGESHILEYRGQSFLFYLTMYVPRDLWPGKPWPYQVYLTAHALQTPIGDRGWGITSSFLDESVSNVGWAGLLIGPMVFALLCRICDSSPDLVIKVLGLLVPCLLMAVEGVGLVPLVFVWLIYMAWSRRALARQRLGVVRDLPLLAEAR